MSPRLFMLDDDPAVVRVVRVAAEREGWQFLSAGTAGEALPAALKFGPDIILLDVEFPGGNGFQVCRELRAQPSLGKIPVIFLTGKGEIESRLQGFEAGGQDYVAKPFAVEELTARVRAHLAIKGRLDAMTREKEELAVRDRLRQDLVDMFVHDLRAPLGSIRVALGLLAETGAVSGAEHGLLMRCAEDASEFAIFMVNDLLDLGAGKVGIKAEPLDAKALAERLRTLFRSPCERHKLAFKVDLPEELPAIATDAMLLFRILANLLSNAVKFCRAGNTVSLRVRAKGAGLRVEVVDDGPGIPDTEKSKIFQKYYRADTAVTKAVAGSGIGLAFCRMAAEQLGGLIGVEDAEGGGCRFFLELPAAPLAAAPRDADPLSADVIEEYIKECRGQLDEARRLAEALGGAEAAPSAGKLRALAHQWAGSAGTYGFARAGEEARKLEAFAVALANSSVAHDGKVRARALALIEKVRQALP